MKKRILAVVLVLAMSLALCGCCLKHDFAPATCTEPETCTKCGKTQGEALGHTWVDATCTEPKTCTVCGETEGEALGHTWADATCTEPKTCTVCGETEGEALGHTWADATCTEPKTCTVCGETEGEALGHTWADATCTEPKTCTACGETEGEALGHTWADATCIEPKTCTVCGETEGEALGHTWADATCIEPKTCTVCGETEGEALGHTWADATCTEPKTCTVCGETEGEALGHTWADATMNEPRTCTVCGETEGVAIKDETAVTINGKDYSVAQMSFEYGKAYSSFMQNYGNYASFFGFDPNVEPAEQAYGEEGKTWKDFFTDDAIATVKINQAILEYAAEKGIELSEEEIADVNDYIEAYSTYLAENTDVSFEDTVKAIYGENTTKEMLVQDTLDSLLVQKAYSAKYSEVYDAVTEDEIKAEPRADVRHILIGATADENGEFTDEALEKAKCRAGNIFRLWQNGEATEESFAAMASKYSDDFGSVENGGLYEGLEPGATVEEFNNFCFDEARVPGDTAIVYGSNGAYAGYHIMYYVGNNEDASRAAIADRVVNEWYYTIIDEMTAEPTEFMAKVG